MPKGVASLMPGRKAWWLGLVLLLFVATVVIGEINIAAARKTEIAVDARIHKCQGVLDADRTTEIVQKAKIKKDAEAIKQENQGVDPEKAPAMLAEIDQKKMPLYKTINRALLSQKEIYASQAENRCTQANIDQFNRDTEAAKAALKDLKSLTEEQVKIYRATTKDEQAIKVAWSNYYTWESAVSGLSSEPLEDARMAEIDTKIQEESTAGISAAEEQAKSVNGSDLEPADKQILEKEVLADGKNVLAGLQGIMNAMQIVIQDLMRQIQGSAGVPKVSKNPLGALSAMASGKPPIDMSVITNLQKTFESIGSQLQAFSGSFGSFMQAAGSLVGMQIPLTPLQMPIFKP